VTAGVVYYSGGRCDERILAAARLSIEASGLPIVAVTLQPLRWPSARSIVLPYTRGIETMFRQILAGLEAIGTDLVFLAEHDVVYAAEHWLFRPPDRSRYWYNLNTWKVDAATGRAVTYETKQTSGLCADRHLLMAHYRARVDRVAREGYSTRMGYEPGSHGRPERIDDVESDTWRAARPNIDVRHSQNLTASRWRQSEFRSQRSCRGWTESDQVPGWGRTAGRFDDFLDEVTRGAVERA
jgi:hypothetical protein